MTVTPEELRPGWDKRGEQTRMTRARTFDYIMTHGAYPPSDATRDEAVAYLQDILWVYRPLILAASPSSEDAIDKANRRATAILLGC